MLTFRRKGKCGWLVLALLILIFLVPFVQPGKPGGILLGILATIVFLAGIYSVSDSARHVWIGLLLMLPPFVMQWLSVALQLETHHFFLEPSFYQFPFYIFLIYLIARYVFEQGHVTKDRLFGAASIYLLIGLFYTHVYLLLERVNPGSFSVGGDALGSTALEFRDFLYFSYATLTTLGYGDIAPITAYARSFALLEAILGVLTIGILIARLAGAIGAEKPVEPDLSQTGDEENEEQVS